MLHNDLGKDLLDDPMHSSCTGIGYHSDIVPLETIMTVVARQFALMTEAGYEEFRDLVHHFVRCLFGDTGHVARVPRDRGKSPGKPV